MSHVADSSPEQVSKGELLHALQHQNRHERDEGVLDEEAEPIPRKGYPLGYYTTIPGGVILAELWRRR